jgi:hypothetical protein
VASCGIQAVRERERERCTHTSCGIQAVARLGPRTHSQKSQKTHSSPRLATFTVESIIWKEREGERERMRERERERERERDMRHDHSPL